MFSATNRNPRLRPLLALGLPLMLLIAACSGDDAFDRAPVDAVNAVSDEVLESTSLRFQVAYEGEPIEVQTGLTLDRVDGVFEAPDRSKADVRVETLGLTAILEVITEGERVWQKVPFATAFEEVVGSDLITGGDIFSDDGLGLLLREDLRDLAWHEVVEVDAFPGESLATMTGAVSGSRLLTLTLGYLQGSSADVTLYLSGDELRRLVLVESDTPVPRTWTIDLWAYGQPVDIVSP